MTQEQTFVALADDMWRFAQDAFRRVFTDVVYWQPEPGVHRIAFVGDPLKTAQTFGMLTDDSPGSNPYLPTLVYRALRQVGIPVDEQQWHLEPVHLFDFLSRFGDQVFWQWARARGVDIGDGARATFIPEPGYPWPAVGERFYSAKAHAWKQSPEPPWLIDVENTDPDDADDETVFGVNPCLFFPPNETKTSPGGPVCGELDGRPIIVTHCSKFAERGYGYKSIDESAKSIRDCGGFLFPSLAVGPIPATDFGPVIFVAHLELVTGSLSPYRKRSKRPCWVYGTDAWTGTTGYFAGRMAVELFDELHGHDDWLYGQMAVLGMPANVQGGGDFHEPITSTRKLAASLRTRMRGWYPDLTLEQFSERDGYAYTEAKGREVVRLDEFPFIVAPSFLGKQVKRFAKDVEYAGELLLVRVPGWMEEAILSEDGQMADWGLYRWGWMAAEVIRGLRPTTKVLV